MAHEDPIAYLVGVEGLALLRAFSEGRDAAFVESRLSEVRQLLDARDRLGAAVHVEDADVDTGYGAWAPSYDKPGNAAFDLEVPHVRQIVDVLPPGAALDAACGTGRHAEHLAAGGHQVIGVDASEAMLRRAREKVPDAEFRCGSLDRLPVADNAVDLVVCALVLSHLRDVAPAYAEFARVLRPGGHLVVSDLHHEAVLRGSQPAVHVDGRPARIRNHRHHAGAHLRPALEVGFIVAGCVEPTLLPAPTDAEPPTTPGPWETWPWSLTPLIPEAAAAASDGEPALTVWHFRAED